MTRKLFFLFPCLLEEFTSRKVHSKEDFKFVLWWTRFMCVRVFQHFLSSYLLLISCKAFTLIYDTVLNITDNLAKTCHKTLRTTQLQMPQFSRFLWIWLIWLYDVQNLFQAAFLLQILLYKITKSPSWWKHAWNTFFFLTKSSF